MLIGHPWNNFSLSLSSIGILSHISNLNQALNYQSIANCTYTHAYTYLFTFPLLLMYSSFPYFHGVSSKGQTTLKILTI